MKDRGDYELKILSKEQRMQREELPDGVGLEMSPFWDFQKAPYNLFKHMLRYFFISEEVWNYAITNFQRPVKVNVLDIGSGYGEMKVFLRSYVRPQGFTLTYTGCDIDPLRMQRARELVSGIDILPIAPLPDGILALEDRYNVFICSEVYEHLTVEQGLTLLGNIRQIAQPGAVAVFTIPTPDFGKSRQIPMHLNETMPEDFLTAATDSGWQVHNWYYLKGGRVKKETKNIPAVMRSTYLTPQFADKGNHAIYILKLG